MYSPDLPRLMVTRPKRFAIYTPALAGGQAWARPVAGGSRHWVNRFVNLESAPVFEPGTAKVNKASVLYRHILTATGVAAGLTRRLWQLLPKPVFANSAAFNLSPFLCQACICLG